MLVSWYEILGGPAPKFSSIGIGVAKSQLEPHVPLDARDPASKPNVMQTATEGHVLLKNTKNALPLRKPLMLSLHGYDEHVIP